MKCKNCKITLVKSHHLLLYCSEKCRELYKVKIYDKKCLLCKKHFKGRKVQKYCTKTCVAYSRADDLKKIQQARRKYPLIEGLNRCQIYRKFNKEKNNFYLDRDSMKRTIVIQYLGGKCIRCEYDQDLRALQLDHIRGDGGEDRKRLGSRICRYYVKNLEEAKINLQVFCANCHAIKTHIMEERTRGKDKDPTRNIGYEEFA